MNHIYEKENNLWNDFKQKNPCYDWDNILIDGLCLSDIRNARNLNDISELERLWIDSRIRVLFLLKEGVDQGGDDYRDYLWESEKCKCQIKSNLRKILWHLNNLSSCAKELANNVCGEYPFAIVNIKKISRCSETDGTDSNWHELRDYAKKHKEFLKKQIQEILNPSIIVCCGCDNKDSIISIATDYIFDDIKFNEFHIGPDLWCKYNTTENIFLLNSYHLSYGGCNVDKLINAFKQLLTCYNISL